MGLHVCFKFKILNHTNQPEQLDLSYPGYDEHKSGKKMFCIYSKHNTQAILKDYSSNLRYILNTYRKVVLIQISVFCFCTIFSYTNNYHPHKCLKIVFFKPVHMQFH